MPVVSGAVPAILTGDLNVRTHDELDILQSNYSFRDGFLAARPISASSSPFLAYPTYGLTLTNRKSMFGFKDGAPKRLDYTLIHSEEIAVEPKASGFIGDKPVCTSDIATDEEGEGGNVWASDHLGIWVNVKKSMPGADGV